MISFEKCNRIIIFISIFRELFLRAIMCFNIHDVTFRYSTSRIPYLYSFFSDQLFLFFFCGIATDEPKEK